MNDAIRAHFGHRAGVGYDFSCAAGHAGLVLMGEALDYSRIFAEQHSGDITVNMPCGETITFDELPGETTACACGDPKHWFSYHVGL